MTIVESASPEDTIRTGKNLAAALAPGAVVALHGDLGAGKTCFVGGLVAGWDGDTGATSPTFTLLHEYPTPRGPIFHLDLYRARSADEVWAAAHDELGAPHALTIIEWAARYPELLPPHAIHVSIHHVSPTSRTITITP